MACSASCTQRFSILFSYLAFCFLSSRTLQNDMLHLYLVKVRLYKRSFFAKQATKSLPHFSISAQFSKNRGVKLITYRGLELAKSICAPNLEAIITKIVGALWLVERRVCMRVCKHGCDVKMFCFSRANHASTNLKKVLSWKTRQVYFIYPFPRRLKLEKSLETCWVHLFLLELTF